MKSKIGLLAGGIEQYWTEAGIWGFALTHADVEGELNKVAEILNMDVKCLT